MSSGLKSAGLRSGTKLKLVVDTLHRQGYSKEEIRAQIEKKQDDVVTEDLGTTPAVQPASSPHWQTWLPVPLMPVHQLCWSGDLN